MRSDYWKLRGAENFKEQNAGTAKGNRGPQQGGAWMVLEQNVKTDCLGVRDCGILCSPHLTQGQQLTLDFRNTFSVTVVPSSTTD